MARRLGVGAGILLAAAGTACVQPPPGPGPATELEIDVIGVSSSCNDLGCTGTVRFRVTNVTDDPSTGEPIPTVVPDQGTAVRDVGQSTCDDPPLPLGPGQSCTERYILEADEGPLTGTISVDAGDLEGGTTYSA